jgi:hypothetical protein
MRTRKQSLNSGRRQLVILIMIGCSETQKQTSAEKAQPEQAEKAAPMAQTQEFRRSLKER